MNNYLSIGIVAILIVSNVVIIAILVARLDRKISKQASNRQTSPLAQLSEETINRLEKQTQTAFKASVEQASKHFDQDIDKTSKTLSDLIIRLTTSVVEEELVQYRQSLSEARAVALQSLSDMQKTVKQQQTILQVDMQAAIDKRRTELLDRLDQKIGVVATNYIVEALGQGVDLGAQRDYLLNSLEQNKAILKKDILGEL